MSVKYQIKGNFTGLLMQFLEKSVEQREKRWLPCNWSWANVYRFCCMALDPVH